MYNILYVYILLTSLQHIRSWWTFCVIDYWTPYKSKLQTMQIFRPGDHISSDTLLWKKVIFWIDCKMWSSLFQIWTRTIHNVWISGIIEQCAMIPNKSSTFQNFMYNSNINYSSNILHINILYVNICFTSLQHKQS